MKFLSKLFGNESKDDAETREIEVMTRRIIDDETFQNSLVPEVAARLIREGSAVDKLPNGFGAFGFEVENPIPVNGPIGELAYLSRLETMQGEHLLFHRIGAVKTIDAFEAVTYSGGEWFIFFLDAYHPRRSRSAPAGFQIAPAPRQFSGFHNYCKNFPYDYPEARRALSEATISLAYIPTGSVVIQLQQRLFNRSLAHKTKMGDLKTRLTSRLS